MTCCGSSSSATRGFSGNGLLLCRGTANGVVLRFGVVNDDRRRRLLGHQLESFGELHAKSFFRRQELEHGVLIVGIGTRAVAPRVTLSAVDTQLALDAPVRPLGHGLG